MTNSVWSHVLSLSLWTLKKAHIVSRLYGSWTNGTSPILSCQNSFDRMQCLATTYIICVIFHNYVLTFKYPTL